MVLGCLAIKRKLRALERGVRREEFGGVREQGSSMAARREAPRVSKP